MRRRTLFHSAVSSFALLAVFATGAVANSVPALTIEVKAEQEVHALTPIVVTVDHDIYLSEPLKLVRDGETVACMPLPSQAGPGHTDLAFIVSGLQPNETRTYRLESGHADPIEAIDLRWRNEELEFRFGNWPFTHYHFITEGEIRRPIFHPVYGPLGVRMTRGFPMEPQDGEPQDHPHQQSFYVAHGDINGVDFWHRGGYTRHQKFDHVHLGPACAQFAQINHWVDSDNNALLHERRVVTLWGTPEEARIVDVDMTFTPVDGDVVFGDTKEGGLIALRVAQTLQENREDGGTITNSKGQVTEREAWGNTADWCDYSGPVEDQIAGLTIMVHPDNPFETHFHVRAYGLFAANPFGRSDFGLDYDGSRTLADGESWRFRYRVYIHEGDVETGAVAQAYASYVNGVSVNVR